MRSIYLSICLNAGGIKLNYFVAIKGKVILIDNQFTKQYINTAVISTFNELNTVQYAESIFQNMKKNLAEYFADERFKQSIDLEVSFLTPFVIKNELSNDEFQSKFNSSIKKYSDNYVDNLLYFSNEIENSMTENMDILE